MVQGQGQRRFSKKGGIVGSGKRETVEVGRSKMKGSRASKIPVVEYLRQVRYGRGAWAAEEVP